MPLGHDDESKNRDIDANRRAEYAALRSEIYDADRTCVLVMGFLVTITASAGSVVIGLKDDEIAKFLLWILSPVYLLGFWYFTEKRFVIRITAYIRQTIEKPRSGFWWAHFLQEQSREKTLRPAFPFDPYHLETVVCGAFILGIPLFGTCVSLNCEPLWDKKGWEFISTALIALVFVSLAIRAWWIYGRPLEYDRGHTRVDPKA